MALFSREPRFKDSHQTIVAETIRYSTQKDNEYVGPGYHGTDIFSHWTHKSFSKRAPMEPSKKDRLDFRRMIRSECLVEPTSYLDYEAGPGFYGGQVTNHYSETIHHVGRNSVSELSYYSPLLRKSHNVHAPSPRPAVRRSRSQTNQSFSPLRQNLTSVQRPRRERRSNEEQSYSNDSSIEHGSVLLNRQAPAGPRPSAVGDELDEAAFVSSAFTPLNEMENHLLEHKKRGALHRNNLNATTPVPAWHEAEDPDAGNSRATSPFDARPGSPESWEEAHDGAMRISTPVEPELLGQELAPPRISLEQSASAPYEEQVASEGVVQEKTVEVAKESVGGGHPKGSGGGNRKAHPLSGVPRAALRRQMSTETTSGVSSFSYSGTRSNNQSDRTELLQWHSTPEPLAADLLSRAFPPPSIGGGPPSTSDSPSAEHAPALIAKAFPPKPGVDEEMMMASPILKESFDKQSQNQNFRPSPASSATDYSSSDSLQSRRDKILRRLGKL